MLKALARLYLRLWGFTLIGGAPPLKKYVILAAPHTSNWDVPLMLSVAICYGIRVRWIGKHTLFKFPLKTFMTFIGGLPVDRRSPKDYVSQMREAFERSDELYLLITPEGTRSRSEYWKSGFYYIAMAAKVPIALAQLDFKTRLVGITDLLEPSGDLDADMEIMRRYYDGKQGLHPEDFGPVRVRPREDRAAANKSPA